MSQVRQRQDWNEIDLFEQLHDEFGDRVDLAFLHEVAHEEVGSFGDAKVRDFVPLIAYRQARQRVARRLESGGIS